MNHLWIYETKGEGEDQITDVISPHMCRRCGTVRQIERRPSKTQRGAVVSQCRFTLPDGRVIVKVMETGRSPKCPPEPA